MKRTNISLCFALACQSLHHFLPSFKTSKNLNNSVNVLATHATSIPLNFYHRENVLMPSNHITETQYLHGNVTKFLYFSTVRNSKLLCSSVEEQYQLAQQVKTWKSQYNFSCFVLTSFNISTSIPTFSSRAPVSPLNSRNWNKTTLN